MPSPPLSLPPPGVSRPFSSCVASSAHSTWPALPTTTLHGRKGYVRFLGHLNFWILLLATGGQSDEREGPTVHRISSNYQASHPLPLLPRLDSTMISTRFACASPPRNPSASYRLPLDHIVYVAGLLGPCKSGLPHKNAKEPASRVANNHFPSRHRLLTTRDLYLRFTLSR